MFKFLKKLFFEPVEETQEEGIKVDELGKWFSSKTDEVFSSLDVRIKEIKSKIEEEVTNTKDNLAILSTATLHNPKISVREKQFMEGNRRAYVLAVNSFLRGVEVGDGDYDSFLAFCDDFTSRLDKFGKSSARAYHILQEFFANESRDIAINIKNLGSGVSELRKAILDAHIKKINSVKNEIEDLNSKLKTKDDFENKLKEKEETKNSLLKNQEDFGNSLEKLVKGKEYKHLNELKANKEAVLASVREHNAKVVHAFSVMEKPLRKLSRVVVEDNQLLQKYMENPVQALVEDSDLKIASLLKKLEKQINNYTLDLKDKKREKVLETIKGLTEEFLREFIAKHNELNGKLENLEKEISENEALKKENKLNFELSNVKDNLEKVKGEITEVNIGLDKINVGSIKKSLEKEINGLLGENIVIV